MKVETTYITNKAELKAALDTASDYFFFDLIIGDSQFFWNYERTEYYRVSCSSNRAHTYKTKAEFLRSNF